MLTGSMVALVTPFRKGRVDEKALRGLIEFQIQGGTSAIVPCGTTGESATLSHSEHNRVIELTVKAVRGRVPVIAGTGSNSTAEAIALTRHAKKVRADGALLICPYYNRPTQEGLYRHFKAIAKAVDLPLVLYNIPSRTGRLIEVDTLARLSEHDSIVAVKDAVENVEFTSQTVSRVPGLPVYSGQDSHTWPMMAVGAVGVVSVISHLAGRMVAAMVEAALAGNMSEARRLHHELLPLCEACFLETNPTPVKGAMNRLWEPVGDVRLPLVAASEETLIAVEKAVGAIQGL